MCMLINDFNDLLYTCMTCIYLNEIISITFIYFISNDNCRHSSYLNYNINWLFLISNYSDYKYF